MRPGEKLYEELFDSSEKTVPTFHEKLRIAIPEPILVSKLNELMYEFEHVVKNHDVDNIIPAIQKIIPSFKHKVNLETKNLN